MTRFYTRTGDDGFTGLLGEGRVPKYHPQPEAVGEVDEASAALGLARATCQSPKIGPLLLMIQRDLYKVMAELAALPTHAEKFRSIDSSRVSWLEVQTDEFTQLVSVPNEFIVPGDSAGGAALALARTITRRAERRIAELLHNQLIQNQELLRYLNRLSSLCFVLELLENKEAGQNSTTLAKEE
jgi:cob(I)alamin adenosyltransferase